MNNFFTVRVSCIKSGLIQYKGGYNSIGRVWLVVLAATQHKSGHSLNNLIGAFFRQTTMRLYPYPHVQVPE